MGIVGDVYEYEEEHRDSGFGASAVDRKEANA